MNLENFSPVALAPRLNDDDLKARVQLTDVLDDRSDPREGAYEEFGINIA